MNALSGGRAVCLLAVVTSGAAFTAVEKTVVSGNTAFACELYDRLRGQDGNLFFSPYSISTALAMTYGGARGNTEAQMARVMHFDLPQSQLHASFAAMQNALNGVQSRGTVTLSMANSLWPQEGYDFLPAFQDLCKSNYSVTITPLDFAGAAEPARVTINEWVEEKTQGRIRDLFKPGVLDSMTRLALVNAVYFKGTWATQFNAEQTRAEPFHLNTGLQVNAPLMHLEKSFRYAETPDLQILEMPYAGNELSLLALLPREVDGLPALESKLTAGNLAAWTQGLRLRKASVWLPRFKTTSEFSLNQSLSDLGMSDAFSSKADFSGMDGKKDLLLSAVVHKAFVEVNEEGTEAAAATGVGVALTSIRPAEDEPVVFRADHPFLFVIRENRTGILLFLGRIMDPTR